MTNNNESMATVVETFFVEETTNLIHDGEALKTWSEKCAELGLEGQKEVVTVGKSPIPFLWMNDALVATFETLCPTKVKITAYDKSPIPVEILELVSLSQKESYFDFMEIWFNEQVKDPVCVGYRIPDDHKNKSEWERQYYAKKYLLGRWADVKASLDTLVERAKNLFIAQTTTALKQNIKNFQRQLEDVEMDAARKFGEAMPATTGLPF